MQNSACNTIINTSIRKTVDEMLKSTSQAISYLTEARSLCKNSLISFVIFPITTCSHFYAYTSVHVTQSFTVEHYRQQKECFRAYHKPFCLPKSSSLVGASLTENLCNPTTTSVLLQRVSFVSLRPTKAFSHCYAYISVHIS